MTPPDVLRSLQGEWEVVRWHQDLDAAGVPHVFLKGVGFDRWLDRKRISGDVDLLVPRRHRRRAEAVLRSAGYVKVVTEPAATTWCDPAGRLPVDLHDTLKGAGVPAPQVWAELVTHVERVDVAGLPVPVLGSPARELLALLHVALGGGTAAVADLQRAVERTSLATWAAALDLASTLGAERFAAMGLSALDGTRVVAEQLGVEVRPLPPQPDRPATALAVAFVVVLAQRSRTERLRLAGRLVRLHPRAAAFVGAPEGRRSTSRGAMVGRRVAAVPAGIRSARQTWSAPPITIQHPEAVAQ